MSYFKRLLGIVCILVMGFLAYCAVTGFGVLIGLILVIFPTWQIVLGTVLGTVCVSIYLLSKKG